MNRAIVKKIHPVTGGLAMLMISGLLISTIIVELSGDPLEIAELKESILFCVVFGLIPLMMITGISGNKLGAISEKAKRMKRIAINGLLVLIPSAVVLWKLSAAGDFGTLFMAVQGVEIVAGILNLYWMGLNMRDGMRIKRASQAMELKGEV